MKTCGHIFLPAISPNGHRRGFVNVFAALVCSFATPALAVQPGGVSNSAEIRDSGEIQGSIALCGPEGTAGLIVYIPGQSFSVITGTGGGFKLRYVPQGVYDLAVMKNGQIINTLNGVTVLPKTSVNVGVIDLNLDRDNDGYNACVDCNDLNPAINPSATELCDGVDNNCDAQVDEGCTTCTDADQDGFFAQAACGTPVDCDDANAAVNPNTTEVCHDGIDNNCNGGIDEECTSSCIDADGDGYYNSTPGCNAAVWDCNDADPQVNPGAAELCDAVDNDCDAQVDEGLPTTWTAVPHGSWMCSHGVELISCGPGFYSCDGNVINGCESLTPCP